MKKILIATTMLVGSAGIAAADISLSGLGRFGVNYDDSAVAGAADTTIGARLRFNITGTAETDSGVTFGGRVRIQYDALSGSRGAAASNNAGMLFATFGGVRLEVGNSNTAIDSAGLWYASEIGYDYSISGNGVGNFNDYASSPTPVEYMGVFASYAVGDLTVRASVIQDDQTVSGGDDEVSISADYEAGAFAVSLAAVQDSGNVAGDDSYFLGAQYSFGDATIAALYYDEEVLGFDVKTVTLTGSYAMGDTTLQAFISSSDDRGPEDMAYGLGFTYDLGGATLAGAIGKDFADTTNANLGVRFDF